jgi:hypothetical protein
MGTDTGLSPIERDVATRTFTSLGQQLSRVASAEGRDENLQVKISLELEQIKVWIRPKTEKDK